VRNNEISPFGCIHTLFKPLLFCGLKRSFLFSSRGKHFDICDPDSAIPTQILEYISMGQNWPEGDAAFHRRILVPTLLVHGLQDKQVTLVQQCEMERVRDVCYFRTKNNYFD
jgi:abhydrolase domain-containing protein 8